MARRSHIDYMPFLLPCPLELIMDLQIRELRKQLGLSQKRLARQAGLSLEIVRDIESGVREVAHEDVERVYQVLLTGDSLSVK